jgi:enamine deaminase RidA (YjgF/YER057c/UK114 family)
MSSACWSGQACRSPTWKVTQYLTRAEDIPAYAKVRTRFLGDARPASMLLVIPQLVRPDFLVEVEIVAAKE